MGFALGNGVTRFVLFSKWFLVAVLGAQSRAAAEGEELIHLNPVHICPVCSASPSARNAVRKWEAPAGKLCTC